MKNAFACLLFVTISILFTGCMNLEDIIDEFLPKDVDYFARESINLAKSKDMKNLMLRLDESIKDDQIESSLSEIFNYMDKGEISEIITTGVQVNEFNENITYNISYQIKYRNSYQLANLVLFDDGNGLFIKGFHINDISDSLDKLNKFTFEGKSAKHYVFFALNVSYILFIVAAIVSCVRTKNLNKKWMWVIISLVGVVEVLFNWTTGVWKINPISLGFNISSFVPPIPFIPSILKFYIPVGAMAFFIKKSTLNKDNEDQV